MSTVCSPTTVAKCDLSRSKFINSSKSLKFNCYDLETNLRGQVFRPVSPAVGINWQAQECLAYSWCSV